MTSYAIVGDGATGTTAAFYIRRGDPKGRIRIYSDDPIAAYYRAALTNYLMGELRADQLFAVPPTFYQQFGVERVLTRVISVDTKDNRLELSNGQKAAYDQLLIASGARATMPPFPGSELSGVMTMRTMQDARVVMDLIGAGKLKRAVVVGGGILGLELVAGLRTRSVEVTWVIRGDSVVSPPLDRAGSDLVLGRCRQFGVDVRLNEEVGEVTGDKKGKLRTVAFRSGGGAAEAQLLAVSIGITPNVEFLEGSGIKTNRGVVVDDHLRSSTTGVYAGGDVAEVNDPFSGKPRVIGLWEPARYHGRVAGMNMTGGSETWKMEVPYTATRLYDLDVGAVGQTIEEPTDEVEVDFPKAGSRIGYRKLVFRGEKLAGALLLGTRQEKVRARARMYRKLIAAGSDVSEIRDRLLDPFFDLGAWMDSQEVPTEAPRAMATIAGPAIRTSMSTVLGKLPAAREQPAPGAAVRQTLSNLMRPAEGLGGKLVPPAPAQPSAPPPGAGRQPRVEASGGRQPRVEASATLRLDDGRVVTIGEFLSIGRSKESNLVIEDDTVSGGHAEVTRRGSSFVISDLGSRNGTSIDERKIGGPHTLRHGQVIALGDFRMTFFQQALPPRATMGPAGLPSEPLEAFGEGGAPARIELNGKTVEIMRPETSIGRDPASEVAVEDPAVSWLHAQITRHGPSLYLRDLGSSNGTFVGGTLVTIPHQLSDGDVIHVGNTDLRVRTAAADGRPQPEAANGRPQPEAANGRPQPEAAEPAAAGIPSAEPTPVPEGSRLVGKSGSAIGMSFALQGRSMTIGRDLEAAIYLKDLTVSRAHARFEHRGEDWLITDLGSTNGTQVAGKRLEPNRPVVLSGGEEIKAGDVILIYEKPEKARIPAPSEAPGPPKAAAPKAAAPKAAAPKAAAPKAAAPKAAVPKAAVPKAAAPKAAAPKAAAPKAAAPKAAAPKAAAPKAAAPKAQATAVAPATGAKDKPPRATVRVTYRLVITKGKMAGQEIPLETTPLVVGRATESGVFGIEDQFVSGRHAEFDRAADGAVSVTDLGSTNGTTVNDEPLAPGTAKKLKAGDRIDLGPAITIEVEIRPS